MANLLVAEKELQTIARAKPVVRPSLRALSGAAHPAPQHIAVVRISVQIAIRGVIKAGRVQAGRYRSAADRVVRVPALDPKIHFPTPPQLRDTKPTTPSAAF